MANEYRPPASAKMPDDYFLLSGFGPQTRDSFPPHSAANRLCSAGATSHIHPVFQVDVVASSRRRDVPCSREADAGRVCLAAVLRSRLSDMFLELTVDDENRVAFVRQVPQHGETDIPILLRRQPLTFLQSAGLLILRAALASASAAGQRAVIGGAELIADLGAYEDPSKSDKARFAKQCAAVVEALKKVSILRPIPGSADRFEVSPTLALLLPAEQLEALTKTYERLRQERGRM